MLEVGVSVSARAAGKGAATNAAATVDAIVEAEQLGIGTAWMGTGGMAPDPLAVYAAAAMKTSRIKFGTSILVTYPRHPMGVAQSAIALDQLAPGRLRLGFGPGHKGAIESAMGIPFAAPLGQLRDYITILSTLFREAAVSYEGKHLTLRARIPEPVQAEVLISALRANAFRLAGEAAAGAISWMCPVSYLREVALPAMDEGAAKAGRPRPALIAHVPVAVTTDADAVRSAATRQLGGYTTAPYYATMLRDAGFPEALEQQSSERMADALVIHGDADTVKARLRELPALGIGEIIAAPLNISGDPDARLRTLRVLGEVAAEG
jgi:F420-dependent oxidoreductase-like protein